ncbi:MAG: aspartate carbamoyltransferase [Methanocalculaceae archaeon]|jgi:aspartate carbamoyltransferase catalytic subunit|nr:aspartate carbamoyltransferase [Methanocalculaceae archaeon]
MTHDQKNILSVRDMSHEEIDVLLSVAAKFDQSEFTGHELDGKILAVLFFEPSTRTRMSFSSAMMRLGGQILNFGSVAASSVVKGETLSDTIRVTSGYADAIVLRHPKEGAARLASEIAAVPVINGGDGAGQHPSQTLQDLFTIRKSMQLENIDVGVQGDLRYGRTVHSLANALTKYDNIRLHTIAPEGLELPNYLRQDLTDAGMEVIAHESIEEIISALDVLYVTRLQRERFPDPAAFASFAATYRITSALLARAKPSMIILHPLPRVDEIDPAVDALPCAKYFQQAHYGVSVRMAMLHEVMRP